MTIIEPATMCFIANPVANRSGNRRMLAALSAIAKAAGSGWHETAHVRHATELAERAARDGMRVVAAVGGDGTVHEVMNGLMRIPANERPALGVVPAGTGNDFALGAELFTTDSVAAMRRVLTCAALRSIDVALLEDEHGQREYFDNTLGIGFDAAANLQARAITRLRGFPMYLLAVLRTIAGDFKAANLQVSTEEAGWSRPSIMFSVGNGRREGGGFVITPSARMDDGRLDYMQVDRINRLQMLLLLPRVMNGTHIHHPRVHMGHFKTARLRLDRSLAVHIDGEIFGAGDSRELTITVQPGALRLVA